MAVIPTIFDHALLDCHRQRALLNATNDTDFLWQELATRLLDRLDDVKREFPIALEVGAHHGGLRKLLAGKYGIQQLIQIDSILTPHHTNQPLFICGHEEISPIAPQSIDLIVSIASLQWVNDLPGCLIQLLHALKPDGLFMAIIPGEETLMELRQSLDAAMLSCKGGISPRISPMLEVQDAADLMQRAGFALPVVDRDRIQVAYSDPIKLMHDLRAMGQTNALIQRNDKPLTKRVVETCCDYYITQFPHDEGGVCATFDMITLTGWAPHASQAKPLPRGSATASLKEIL